LGEVDVLNGKLNATEADFWQIECD
jgi:hypothetical protein